MRRLSAPPPPLAAVCRLAGAFLEVGPCCLQRVWTSGAALQTDLGSSGEVGDACLTLAPSGASGGGGGWPKGSFLPDALQVLLSSPSLVCLFLDPHFSKAW